MISKFLIKVYKVVDVFYRNVYNTIAIIANIIISIK